MAFIKYAKARRHPNVRKRINEATLEKRMAVEIVTDATWARRTPGVRVGGNLDVQIDITAAIAANFS